MKSPHRLISRRMIYSKWANSLARVAASNSASEALKSLGLPLEARDRVD